MSDALTTTPAGPPPAAVARVNGKEIRGKLKQALDLLVYGDRDEAGNLIRYDHLSAARKVGFTTQAMRKALERPHVLRYLTEQRQVFRAHAAAGNILRAVELRDQDENKTAAIQAIKYLDGLGDEQQRDVAGRAVSPGVVVTVNINRGDPVVDDTVIEVNPMGAPDTQSGGDGPGNGGNQP